MAAQVQRLVKVERVTHRDGVNRLRKAYRLLWRFSLQRGMSGAAMDRQSSLRSKAADLVQEERT